MRNLLISRLLLLNYLKDFNNWPLLNLIGEIITIIPITTKGKHVPATNVEKLDIWHAIVGPGIQIIITPIMATTIIIPGTPIIMQGDDALSVIKLIILPIIALKGIITTIVPPIILPILEIPIILPIEINGSICH